MATQTLPRPNHNTPLPLLLACLCIIAAGIAVTAHARAPRVDAPVEGDFSRIEILAYLTAYGVDGDKSACKQVILAACPRAVNQMTGAPNPHYKAGCRVNGNTRETGLWLVGIIGTAYDNPVYVTGMPMHWTRFQSTMARDGCAQADVSLLGGLLR